MDEGSRRVSGLTALVTHTPQHGADIQSAYCLSFARARAVTCSERSSPALAHSCQQQSQHRQQKATDSPPPRTRQRRSRNHRNLEEPVLDAIVAVAQLPAFFGGLSEVMRLFKWRIRNSVRRTVGRVESSTAL